MIDFAMCITYQNADDYRWIRMQMIIHVRMRMQIVKRSYQKVHHYPRTYQNVDHDTYV